jgi:cysteine synthase
MAAACSARLLGLKCRIVVPKTTLLRMREKIQKEGAEVEVYGDVWNDSNERALQITKESNKRIFIHPFDDPILWLEIQLLYTLLNSFFLLFIWFKRFKKKNLLEMKL